MENGSVLYFNLSVYLSRGPHSYPAFLLCSLLFTFIVTANISIVAIISRERALHQPMFVFVAFLSVNSLYGSSGFFPRFLADLLSDTHLISRGACLAQIFIIYTYASYEMTFLGIMGYDRYVAVCHPLQYQGRMTPRAVVVLAGVAWTVPTFLVAVCLYLTIRLPLCGNQIQKVYCANWNVVKLSCVTTFVNNLIGFLVTAVLVVPPLVFVLYTYACILRVCWRRSAEFKAKIFQTCLPHTLSFVGYSLSLFFDVALSRVHVESLNPVLAIILSLEFVMVPPLLNPLVYGLKLPEIRKHIFRMFLRFKVISRPGPPGPTG